MRFLVDESTGKKVCDLLKEEGHDSIYVGDTMPGSSDEDVLTFSENEGRILVTDDKDFGELVFRMSRPTSGVILFRITTKNTQKRFRILLHALKNENLEGNFTTIKEDRIKVRKPHKSLT